MKLFRSWGFDLTSLRLSREPTYVTSRPLYLLKIQPVSTSQSDRIHVTLEQLHGCFSRVEKLQGGLNTRKPRKTSTRALPLADPTSSPIHLFTPYSKREFFCISFFFLLAYFFNGTAAPRSFKSNAPTESETYECSSNSFARI